MNFIIKLLTLFFLPIYFFLLVFEMYVKMKEYEKFDD